MERRTREIVLLISNIRLLSGCLKTQIPKLKALKQMKSYTDTKSLL